ncbi:glycosyl hydrolase [Ruficoccus amylovorans]|uniref:Glycosyl hydrolase n=1 Tax=Ruficoccus amylovorans TaxID=1804625 RepID=A0A842HKU9_9BACT|nr:glycosyl hydrolase [Ruficoccus amylovorans]MBC2596304.1 glycosyl hydrolase [Ruficoccus amylovorans]
MKIDTTLTLESLQPALERFWKISGQKIKLIEAEYDASKGSPVFTVEGKYTTRGWTEWTQGFQFGSAILQFDATGDESFLQYGREQTLAVMAPHITHKGVHDHGFNNVSTYGNLRRLMREGKIPHNEWEMNFYEMALKASGSVQAMRWSPNDKGGYLYSFNGPHSLFVDTIRTIRAVEMSWLLGHSLLTDNDAAINLLERALNHARSTAAYNIFYGEGRDKYDEWGRTAHEAIFNINDGAFRCPNAQQGFSGFTTWTRGLSWAMLGFPEQLELVAEVPDAELEPLGGRAEVEAFLLKAARATNDFFIANTASDGIPYWDTGAPKLYQLGNYTERPADPFNDWEPVDSSAAAIGVQGLLRLGKYLKDKGETADGERYWQAGLTSLKALLDEPYLSTDEKHQGLTLHSIYHEPNGWDHVPAGQKIACGEASMWGDYHMRESALLVTRMLKGEPYYRFFN